MSDADPYAGWPRSTFAARVQDHIDEAQVIREGLAHEGPELIGRLMQWPETANGPSMSEIARRVGLSKTYLSRVYNRHEIISPGAFLKLDALLPREQKAPNRERESGQADFIGEQNRAIAEGIKRSYEHE